MTLEIIIFFLHASLDYLLKLYLCTYFFFFLFYQTTTKHK